MQLANVQQRYFHKKRFKEGKRKKKKSRPSVVKSVLEYHQIPVGNERAIPLWKLTGLTEYSFD